MGRTEIKIETAQADLVQVDRFIFLLLPGFSSLDLGAGVDSLSSANAVGGQPRFVWNIVGETGAPVTSSSGMTVAVDGALPETRRGDCIVICAPLDEQQPASPKLTTWLRRALRFGAQLCGLGGSAALLAHTGLAKANRLSTHWKLQPALAEMFPGLDAVCSVYEQEGKVATCGGGVATLDIFSAMISHKCGAEVASHVADQLLYASVRSSDDRQTRSDLCRLGNRNEKLGHAIRIIQASLEAPISPSSVAEQIGLSTRQLERLFQRYVGSSPKI